MTSGHHDNYSSAYTFNSNYIEIKNTPSLNPTKGISIAAWIKLNEYVDNQNFVSKANINKEEPHVSYSLKMGDPGINTKVQFSVALNNLRHNVFSKQAIPLNEWVFLVGVYDGASLHIYINGKLDNSTKASGLISTFNTNVNMGRWSGDIANNPQYLQGSLDDVRMYNRALTQKEIEYLSGL